MFTRMMEWTINQSSGTVIYTCTKCNWRRELVIDENLEPFREFERHICNKDLSPTIANHGSDT